MSLSDAISFLKKEYDCEVESYLIDLPSCILEYSDIVNLRYNVESYKKMNLFNIVGYSGDISEYEAILLAEKINKQNNVRTNHYPDISSLGNAQIEIEATPIDKKEFSFLYPEHERMYVLHGGK